MTALRATSAEPKKLGRMRSLGVSSPCHAPLLLPRRYKDFGKIAPGLLAVLNAEEKAVVAVTVIGRRDYDPLGNLISPSYRDRPARTKLMVRDASGSEASLMIFGATYAWRDVKANAKIHLYCKSKLWNGMLQLEGPELVPSEFLGRPVPIYRQKAKVITSDTASAFIQQQLDEDAAGTASLICSHIGMSEHQILERIESPFQSLGDVLFAIHSPYSMAQATAGKEAAFRIAALSVVESARHVRSRQADQASTISILPQRVAELAHMLPFPLTESQKSAIRDIVKDLRSELPMIRLLTADVGYGKSATFMVPMVAAAEAGAYVAVMAPNALIVDQLIGELKASFPDVLVHRMVSGHKTKQVGRGEIIIGTSAILHWARKSGYKPDFLVVDEQHKQSRQMREELRGPHTNLLEATATPIPRTLALITHAGMDVSQLTDCPVEKHVLTRVISHDDKGRVSGLIDAIMERGEQAAIIYARVSGEAEKRHSIEDARGWWERRYPGKVAVLHGKMSDEEKASVIAGMKDGKFSLLVSTIVVETGVTIPSLSGIVIANADEFGLSTLHQLRGRVARRGGRGYCLLVESEGCDPDGQEHLSVLVSHEAGFSVAEEDMKRRGFGDISEEGDEQSGTAPTLFLDLQVTPELMQHYLN